MDGMSRDEQRYLNKLFKFFITTKQNGYEEIIFIVGRSFDCCCTTQRTVSEGDYQREKAGLEDDRERVERQGQQERIERG